MLLSKEARSEWAAGWTVVAIGLLGMIVSNLCVGAISALIQPLGEQFGWTRAQVSASYMIPAWMFLFLGPVVGMAIDRYGPRRVALWGMTLFCFALAGVGLSGHSIVTWYIAWAVVAVTIVPISAVVWTTGINRCFQHSRGLAFSVALSGAGIAISLGPVITVVLMPLVSWRGVFLAFGLFGLVVALPLIWRFYHPDIVAATKGTGSAGRSERDLTGYSAPQVFRSFRFWSLLVSALFVSSSMGVLVLHFQPMMRDAGLSAEQAAAYASMIGLSAIVGRVLGGYLLDRVPARFVAAVCFLMPGAACLALFQFDGSPAMAIGIAALLGFSLGAEGDIFAYLTGKYFGLRRYGLIFSILFGCYCAFYGSSPVVGGLVFEATGTYRELLKFMIAGLLVSGVLTLMMGQPPQSFEPDPRKASRTSHPA